MKHRRQQARSPENIAGIQHVCIGAHSHGGDMPYGKRLGLQHGRLIGLPDEGRVLVNGQLAMSGNPPISRRGDWPGYCAAFVGERALLASARPGGE